MSRLTVTLCGSLTRARHDLDRVERALALAGHLVDAPCPPLPGERQPTAEQYANLAGRHYAAIDRSQLVIAVVPDGVIGDATDDEMNHAHDAGIPVRVVVYVDEFLADIAAGQLTATEVPA